jgi:predicted permease
MSSAPHRRPPWSTRAFRALLALYPGEFRNSYGREVAMVFEDRYRDARGGWQRALIWVDAIAGVLREAPREHAVMILQDLRFAGRMARRSPSFTLAAVATLALGIGANGAVFQLIDAIGLQTLPVHDPHSLAEVRIVGGNQGLGVNPGPYAGLTRPVWYELETHQQAFSAVAAWIPSDVRIGDRSNLRRARAIAVSGEFFRMLGVQAHRGRLLEPADGNTACPAGRAVVSHTYWERTLGAPDISAGARLTLDGAVHEVVGVTPPGFSGVAVGDSFDVALPLCRPKVVRRELFNVLVVGRLRPDWTLTRASAHLESLSPGVFEASAPTGYSSRSIEAFKAFRLGAFSFARGSSWLRSEYSTSLRMLLAITALVLLLAAANLANLLLARASAREREVAVRLALGASRVTLVRQFMAESVLLAAAGAAVSVLLASNLSRALVWAIATEGTAPTLSLEMNWRMLLFTIAVASAACIIFGVMPAIRATAMRPADALKSGGRSQTDGGRRSSAQRLMVVTQVAVSLVLLVAALLFVRSFRNLMTFDSGMRQQGIAIAFIGYPELSLPPDRLSDYIHQLVDEVRSVPGVADAGATTNLPLLGGSWSHNVRIGAAEGSSKFTWVTPGYFDTMGIPVLRGRGVTPEDTRASRRVAVVNETFARSLAAPGDAIGQTLRTDPEPNYPSTTYEIVGVIPDTKYSNLRAPTPPMVFAPLSQFPPLGPWATVMIHSEIEPASALVAVKQHFAKAHPGVVVESTIFQDRIRDRFVRDRLLAALAGFFGILAGLLAMIGLYGMISFAVAQRRQEIGIRVALGADRHRVVGMMMGEAGRLVAVGVAVGAVVALVAGRSASTLLFGLTPHDPATLVSAAVLLICIAALASYLPARRASRLDPLVALRQD